MRSTSPPFPTPPLLKRACHEININPLSHSPLLKGMVPRDDQLLFFVNWTRLGSLNTFLKYFQYEPDKVFLLKKLLIDTLTMDVALLKCKLLVWSQKKQTCQTSIFKRGPSPGSFCLFSFFSNTILQKTVGFSGIRTRIVRVEGEQAHHLTTVTAPRLVFIQ